MFSLFRNALLTVLVSASFLTPTVASAGGITLGATRVIYPAGQRQVSMSVHNTSDKSSFMVQSWVEDAEGKKSPDFVITPPLYVSRPANENTLRIIYIGQPVTGNKETLYYLNAKSIPSLDKDSLEGKNILLLAATTRIKLFVRPAGLSPSEDKAQELLTFHRQGEHQVEVDNPTPYYITLAQIKWGSRSLPDTMVSPGGRALLSLPDMISGPLTYHTINDFGALTVERHAQF